MFINGFVDNFKGDIYTKIKKVEKLVNMFQDNHDFLDITNIYDIRVEGYQDESAIYIYINYSKNQKYTGRAEISLVNNWFPNDAILSINYYSNLGYLDRIGYLPASIKLTNNTRYNLRNYYDKGNRVNEFEFKILKNLKERLLLKLKDRLYQKERLKLYNNGITTMVYK